MGGGYYDGDVGTRSRATSTEHFAHTVQQAAMPVQERKCHNSLNPHGTVRESCAGDDHPDPTSIVIAVDVTRSRGEDAKVVFDKLPMFIGQIHLTNIVRHPQVCFIGVGDATIDRAPLQVSQFESDNRLDDELKKMWLEKGGGGTGQESYELAAYFAARRMKLDCLQQNRKGIMFFLGDEGFYPAVDRSHVKRIIGDTIQDIPSAKIFAELQERFDTYLIFPQRSWEDRKDDIDAEIRQRVTEAGGMIDGVDVRFSLIWNNRNDLDLYVKNPAGQIIWYGNMRDHVGGELDVDRNRSGETTKPVENTRWPKGKAPRGKYEVWVENYRFHEHSPKGTKFKVEIDLDGQIQTFEGETLDNLEGSQSRVKVGEYFFEGSQKGSEEKSARYDGYEDGKIKAQWASVLPPEHILEVKDPKAVVDLMLGVLAITHGAKTLDQYMDDMRSRDQSDTRCKEVREALKNLASIAAVSDVSVSSIPKPGKKKQSLAASTRL